LVGASGSRATIQGAGIVVFATLGHFLQNSLGIIPVQIIIVTAGGGVVAWVAAVIDGYALTVLASLIG